MKPPELVAAHINNSSIPGQLVFDPFLGSGTTLVACAATGRQGRGIELEPKYVAVALERLTALGLTAQRIATGDEIENPAPDASEGEDAPQAVDFGAQRAK